MTIPGWLKFYADGTGYLDLNEVYEPIYQSPWLYIQATENEYNDDNTGIYGDHHGIHSRWTFRRNLAQRHLPKGDYASDPASPQYGATHGFNKEDDYVYLFWMILEDMVASSVDLISDPFTIIDTPTQKQWQYPKGNKNLYIVTLDFLETGKYDYIKSIITPASDPKKFLEKFIRSEIRVSFYHDSIDPLNEILIFYAGFEVEYTTPGTPSYIQTESISKYDPLVNEYIISGRKTYNFPGTATFPTLTYNLYDGAICVNENIANIRFAYDNGIIPLKIYYTSYRDFINEESTNSVPFQFIGKFALSLDQSEVGNRLDDGKTNIKGIFPRFNDAVLNATPTLAAGSNTVSTDNYLTKFWGTGSAGSLDPDSLGGAIDQYMQLSTDPNNEQAIQNFTAPSGTNDNSVLPMSILDLLNLISLDYHAARMMGLGHIQTDFQIAALQPYFKVFLAIYETKASELDVQMSNAKDLVTHIAMSLPTAPDYTRPCMSPQLDYLSYGIMPADPLSPPITDVQGYSLYDDVRFVNLHKKETFWGFPASQPFYFDQREFNLGFSTIPMLFGVEHRIHDQEWDTPEVSNDSEFQDGGGINEVIPLPEQDNPIYTHDQIAPGIHEYALYGINWFSRASELSDVLVADETIFPNRRKPLPPSNLAAQLIQEEDELILSTQTEQAMLAGITTADKTLLRLTFDWNHVQAMAYDRANTIEFYFRLNPPIIVQGKVVSVTDQINNQVSVVTGPFDITSLGTISTVQPNILPADTSKFLGAVFACGTRQYKIVSILSPVNGNNPRFTLEKVRENTIIENPTGSGIMSVLSVYKGPEIDELFTIAENLNDPAAWDYKLQATLSPPDLDYPNNYTEDIALPNEAIPHIVHIGGLVGPADISPQANPGYFDVEFNASLLLPATGINDVSYYNGTLRVMEDLSGYTAPTGLPPYTAQRRELLVISVDNSGSSLKLIIYDPTYSSIPANGYIPIVTGSSIPVDYHPSFKMYIKTEGMFTEGNTLPTGSAFSKMTYITARSVDTGKSIASDLAIPTVIIGRKITIPLPPDPPDGPLFATRPDFYGKSTYSFAFNFKVNQSHPIAFGFNFYRSNSSKILHELYKRESANPSEVTADQLYRELLNLQPPDSDYNNSRWSDFVNGVYDQTTPFLFKKYGTGTYRIPLPNNDAYKLPDDDNMANLSTGSFIFPFQNVTTLEDIILKSSRYNNGTNAKVIHLVIYAIRKSFSPVTNDPILYKFIKTGITGSGKPPKIKDDSGQPLEPLINTEYDPSPMAVVDLNDTTLIRFTDYKLDGTSVNELYFYAVSEINESLKESDFCEVLLGPVRLVNSYPPNPPRISKVITRLYNPVIGESPSVLFDVNPYPDEQKISGYRIYRATTTDGARTVRNMILAKTVSIDDEIADDYSDGNEIPFGEKLYYRLVAFRTIINESDQDEDILSEPSDIVTAIPVDNRNPQAPEINASYSTALAALNNVSFQWNKTAYNGTYYLYKMNEVGNWIKIWDTKINDNQIQVDLIDTSYGSSTLVKIDGNNQFLFHRFKVKVMNNSGLLNLAEKEITL